MAVNAALRGRYLDWRVCQLGDSADCLIFVLKIQTLALQMAAGDTTVGFTIWTYLRSSNPFRVFVDRA